MKAFFMTVGPTRKQWIDMLGNMTNYLLSAGQWHDTLNYEDQLFGSIPNYIQHYHAEHGDDAQVSYVSAGASTAIYVTMKSIQKAFSSCDLKLTFGDVDQLFYNASAINCSQGNESTTGWVEIFCISAHQIDAFFPFGYKVCARPSKHLLVSGMIECERQWRIWT